MDPLEKDTAHLAMKGEHDIESNHLARLVEIFTDFSVDRDSNLLMHKLLSLAINASICEGGTIYSVTQRNTLQFQCFINDILLASERDAGRLNLSANAEISLFDILGAPVHTHVCSYVYHEKRSVHIEDAYTARDFDCKGIKEFDQNHGYRTKSVLTVPIFAVNQEVIGVMQLINAHDLETGLTIPFAQDTQKFIGALATICGFQMDNLQLIDQLNSQIEANHYTTLEKDRILRDLHDGLGSQLTKASIGLQYGLYSATESIALIDSAIEEMNHIFENYLNFELSLDKMMALTVNQYTNVFKSQKNCVISYRLIDPQVVNTQYPKNVVINLMQVVREILTNSLKYSSAKSLEIVLSSQANLVKLSILEKDLADSSLTLPAAQSRGFGQRNILHRIESQLNGSVSFTRRLNFHLIEINIPNIVA